MTDRLGTGWAFPLQPDPVRGALGYTSGAAKVRDSLVLILSTEPGERVMRPTFGVGLRRYLAEPNSVATRARIEADVAAAVSAFEPRVALREVVAEPGDDPALVVLTLRYDHVRDASPGVLVHPVPLER